MVLETRPCELSNIDLPPLCLKSLTQVQLEKLVPKLVTKVTGRASPLFGTVSQKPDWWPKSIDWINPDELCLKYEDPCETLREIVRSCYQHSEKENLLYADDASTRFMPSTPSTIGTKMCVVEDEGPSRTDDTCQTEKSSKVADISEVEDSSCEKTQETKIIETCCSDSGVRKKTENSGENRINEAEKSSIVTDILKVGDSSCEKTSVTKIIKTNCSDSEVRKKSENIGENGIIEIGKCENVNDTDKCTKPILLDAEESKCKPSLETPVKSEHLTDKSGSKPISIGEISPSIISEIDKHIFAQLGLDFCSVKKVQTKKPRLASIEKENPSKTSKDGRKFNGSTFGDTGLYNVKSVKKTPATKPNDSCHSKTSNLKDSKAHPSESNWKAQTVKCELDQKRESTQVTQEDDDVVWICFICAKGFSNQSDLMTHQDNCEESEDTEKHMESATSANKGQSKPVSHTRERTDIKTPTLDPAQSNQSSDDTTLPVPALLRKVGSDIKSLPHGLPMSSRMHPNRKRKRKPEIYIPPPRDTYFESLGLFPTRNIEQIKTPLKTQGDNCQIIDLTLDEDSSMQSQPMTPRTHLIMTQMSRDETPGTRRRQLSFSQMTPPKVARKQDSNSDSSDDSFEGHCEGRVTRRNIPGKSVILAIPLTSPLGQRLKKHWQGDNKIPVVSNVELYCQTSDVQYYYKALLEEERKGKFTEKLRNRPPPQITFRFTKKYMNKWFHKYKFNKEDKQEFERTFATGLEKRSRKLLSRIKKCKVVLSRLRKKDIKYWTQRRPRMQPSFSNLQLMRQNYNNQIRMGLSQYGIRHVRPGTQYLQSAVTQNSYTRHRHPMQQYAQVVSGPIPQFLVRNGVSSTRLELFPINQSKTYAQTPGKCPPVPRPKQTFQKKCVQDNTVICLSSDEEEENLENNQPLCSKCKKGKAACTCEQVKKPKIGPASFMRHQQSLQQLAQVLRKSVNPNHPVSPVCMVVNTGKADSASSRVFGRSLVKNPCDQTVSTNSVSQEISASEKMKSEILPAISGNQVIINHSSLALNPDYTHVRLTNGQVLQQDVPDSGSSSHTLQTGDQLKQEGGQSLTGAQIDGQVKQEETQSSSCSLQPCDDGSPAAGRNGSVSDSEYMDFEVICIDSDDED